MYIIELYFRNEFVNVYLNYFFHLRDLFQAIERLSKNDPEVIKECCVMLTRVFTTVEFKEKMETFKKEPEKLGLYILNEDEENIENFEEEPEKLDQIFLHEGIIVFYPKDRHVDLLTNELQTFYCLCDIVTPNHFFQNTMVIKKEQIEVFDVQKPHFITFVIQA